MSAGYDDKYVLLSIRRGRFREVESRAESLLSGGNIIRLFIIYFGWLYLNFRGGIIILIVY